MVPLVCCVVVVLFFAVVSFFLFSAGSLSLWFGWGRCAYIMLGEMKEPCELEPDVIGVLLALFHFCNNVRLHLLCLICTLWCALNLFGDYPLGCHLVCGSWFLGGRSA